ncbi:MAG TPA: DJ-1/PfpI family protein [Actinomycetota bacterium]|nr:DJ-1/PfpI family protein [Actinomycetota bacterium]
MKIAFLLYDNMTALDMIGPYEVVGRLPGADVHFVAVEPGVKRTDQNLGLTADEAIDDVSSPDIVVVPGGDERGPASDERLLDWLRSAHETTTWTTSVCTGSLILAASGILKGLKATTHWFAMDRLAEFGATPVSERVVEDGKVITAAGVSSGIDMGLTLAARVAGEDFARGIQLGIEYDPQPPFDAGSPDKAPPELVEVLRGYYTNRV